MGPGNEHDSKRLMELVEKLNEKPKTLYTDVAYDTEDIRGKLSSMSIEPNILVNPRNSRKPKPYNINIYKKMRSVVERFFAWIKSFRRIILRYDRMATTYMAFINLACIIIYLRRGI